MHRGAGAGGLAGQLLPATPSTRILNHWDPGRERMDAFTFNARRNF